MQSRPYLPRQSEQMRPLWPSDRVLQSLAREHGGLATSRRSPPAMLASPLLQTYASPAPPMPHGGDLHLAVELSRSLNWVLYRLGMQLLVASSEGSLEEIEELLERGAPTSCVDEEGRTALHLACLVMADDDAYQNDAEQVSFAMVELLAYVGADTNAQDDNGQTPLHLAAALGREDIVSCLLRHDASVEARAHSGATPLHLAVLCGQHKGALQLLDAGADVNARDDGGHTALHLAAMANDTAMLDLLLRVPGVALLARARPTGVQGPKTALGFTPSEAARATHHPAAEELLLRAAKDLKKISRGD